MSNESENFEMQEASEVARRCLVLYAVVAAGHEESRDDLMSWLAKQGRSETIGPEEDAFFRSKGPSRQQLVNATWRIEAVLPLLWALGKTSELPAPTSLCDVDLVCSRLPPLLEPARQFIEGAALRDEFEIWDAHEETYQAHWAVRDAQLNGKPIPNSYNSGVIRERHLALNWLISQEDAWDDVTTDT